MDVANELSRRADWFSRTGIRGAEWRDFGVISAKGLRDELGRRVDAFYRMGFRGEELDAMAKRTLATLQGFYVILHYVEVVDE